MSADPIDTAPDDEPFSGVIMTINGQRLRASPVIVVDFQMPFMSMVSFMVKWAIAAIPALIVLGFFGSLLFGLFAAVLRSS